MKAYYTEAYVRRLEMLLDQRDAEIERLEREVDDWMQLAVEELKGKNFACSPQMADRHSKNARVTAEELAKSAPPS